MCCVHKKATDKSFLVYNAEKSPLYLSGVWDDRSKKLFVPH